MCHCVSPVTKNYSHTNAIIEEKTMNQLLAKTSQSRYSPHSFRMSSRLIRLMAAATIVLTMLVPATNRVYAADTGTWHGEYFTITDPAAPGATPVLVREDPKI